MEVASDGYTASHHYTKVNNFFSVYTNSETFIYSHYGYNILGHRSCASFSEVNNEGIQGLSNQLESSFNIILCFSIN